MLRHQGLISLSRGSGLRAQLAEAGRALVRRLRPGQAPVGLSRATGAPATAGAPSDSSPSRSAHPAPSRDTKAGVGHADAR